MLLSKPVGLLFLPFLLTLQTAISETFRVSSRDDPLAALRFAWLAALCCVVAALVAAGVLIRCGYRDRETWKRTAPLLYLPVLFTIQTAGEHTILYVLPAEAGPRVRMVWTIAFLTVFAAFLVLSGLANAYQRRRQSEGRIQHRRAEEGRRMPPPPFLITESRT